jgi:hypothetical protein
MFIFRAEHKRDICENPIYAEGGTSLTGHGTYTPCPNKYPAPDFGLYGAAPSIRMMIHERCAVTADQFMDWIGIDWTGNRVLVVDETWHFVAYWVNSSGEDIDWRYDNHQIVFNPAFAEMIGSVELWEIEQFVGYKISA